MRTPCRQISSILIVLAAYVTAYDVGDLDRLQLTIDGPGGLSTIDLTLNLESRFSAEIQGLDAGLTNITLSGFHVDGTEMYSGDWEGQVRADGKATQVALYMVDLKPDIDYASMGNVAPFFTSIEVEPSNIAHNETLTIRTKARDLDGTELNYTVRGIDTLHGELTPCATGSGDTCLTRYRSSEKDVNGIKEFEVTVTDGAAQDRIEGAFNVRAYGGVDIAVVFNSRPGASYINIGPSNFLTPDNPLLTLEVTLFDDDEAVWHWDVRGNGTECDPSRLSGDVQGDFTTRRDVTALFSAMQFETESSCTITLHVADRTSPALEYSLSIPVVVGTPHANKAPHVVYGYSTSRHPAEGDVVTYMVRAVDDSSEQLSARWDTGGTGVVLSEAYNSAPGMVHDFNMEMQSMGQAGTVRCTVEDSHGLQHVTTFQVLPPHTEYTLASTCPAGMAPVIDRNECLDAVSQLGHTWDEDPAHAWEPHMDGGGYCVQCLYCTSHPISYMYAWPDHGHYFMQYCKPANRRLGEVDTQASDAPSPFLFGVDMRIESGTLFVSSNKVPQDRQLAVKEQQEPNSGYPYAILCAVGGVAAVAVGAALITRIQRRHKPPDLVVVEEL